MNIFLEKKEKKEKKIFSCRKFLKVEAYLQKKGPDRLEGGFF